MDCRLYEAALTGDVGSLLKLLEQDSLILDRASIDGETPLHVASLYGHDEFAKTILSSRPKLARVLDSAQKSPLHLASMKGHIKIVELLLQINPCMCIARDQDGTTPLHAAALKGRIEIVKEIVVANNKAARVLSNNREPILHMCVNHNRFDVVKALLGCLHGDDEFVKLRDDNDNTILHVTAAKKHVPLTKFLLQETIMREEVNALNIHGLTALDVLLQNRNKSSNDMKLEGILRRNKAKKASALPFPKDGWMVQPPKPPKDKWKKHVTWLKDTRSVLMIVAILIATVTYQAGVTPPGGVWKDDNNDSLKGHVAGESVMATKYPRRFILFTIFNSIGFLSSLAIILLLISGFPLKKRIFMWALMIITWMAVSSMILTYNQALITTSTSYVFRHTGVGYGVSILSWSLLVALLFIVHIVGFFIRCCKKIYAMTKRGVISIHI